MNRTVIFCMYSLNGQIGSDVFFLLKELRKCVTYIIIVFNGKICMDSKIQNYADAIVVRENVGYDIGAYKCVILSPYYNRIVKESDELILCNSSFYGPFISMDQILKKMECSDSDFWGISSSEKNMVQHIQSYFLVLRNKILKGEELFNYLNNHVDVRKIDYYKACNIFENGLFWELRNAGYIFDAYKRNIDCDNYFNPYGSLKIDGLPILKKKIFSKDFFEKENVLNALAYVKEKYSYNVDNLSILEMVALYGKVLRQSGYTKEQLISLVPKTEEETDLLAKAINNGFDDSNILDNETRISEARYFLENLGKDLPSGRRVA